jgi:hypothetical protein
MAVAFRTSELERPIASILCAMCVHQQPILLAEGCIHSFEGIRDTGQFLIRFHANVFL